MVTAKTDAVGVRLVFAAMVIVIAAGIHPARAQQASGQPGQTLSGLQGVEVLATPYFWMPWTSVGVRPSNTSLPSASNTIDFGQLLTHLTWMPFMGAVEFRNGPYGVLADYLHAPVKAGISTRNILFGGGTGGMTIDTGTTMFLYRPITQPDQYLDVGIGVRAWGFDGEISLNQALLRPVSVSRGGAWADPLIGALSPRSRKRVRADRLRRCRRLRDWRPYRLAGDRHHRLRVQILDRPARRVSQLELQLRRPAGRFRCKYVRTHPRRNLPFLMRENSLRLSTRTPMPPVLAAARSTCLLPPRAPANKGA